MADTDICLPNIHSSFIPQTGSGSCLGVAACAPKPLSHIPLQPGVTMGHSSDQWDISSEFLDCFPPAPVLLHPFLHIPFSVTWTGSLEVLQPPGDKGKKHEEDHGANHLPEILSQEECSSGISITTCPKGNSVSAFRIFCFAKCLHHVCCGYHQKLGSYP